MDPRTNHQLAKALDGHQRGGGFSDQQLFGKDALARLVIDERISTVTHVRFAGGRVA